MTYSELIKRVATATGTSKKTVKAVLDAMQEEVSREILQDHPFRFPRLGTITLKVVEKKYYDFKKNQLVKGKVARGTYKPSKLIKQLALKK